MTLSLVPSRAQPLGAPLLASDGGSLPAATSDVLDRLAPTGADLARDAQVIRIGVKPPAPSPSLKSVSESGAVKVIRATLASHSRD